MSESEKILRELQKGLIIQDHNNYFNNYSRTLSSINTLRQWQITIIAVLFGYAFSQSEVNNPIIINYFVAILFIGFMVIEAIHRGGMVRTGEYSALIEKQIKSANNIDELMQEYQFGNERVVYSSNKSKIGYVLKGILSPSFLFWYITMSFILVSSILLLSKV